MVVTLMLTLLALLLGQLWSGLGQPTTNLAAYRRHPGGAAGRSGPDTRPWRQFGNQEGRLGPKNLYAFVGRLQPGGTQLWLCFDGGSSPNGVADWAAPDTVIVYQLQGGSLVRWDQSSGTTYTVARYLTGFAVQGLGDRVSLALTFTYRDVTRTYTFIARGTVRRKAPTRSGHAMLLVLVFVLLFLSLLGVAYRQLAAALVSKRLTPSRFSATRAAPPPSLAPDAAGNGTAADNSLRLRHHHQHVARPAGVYGNLHVGGQDELDRGCNPDSGGGESHPDAGNLHVANRRPQENSDLNRFAARDDASHVVRHAAPYSRTWHVEQGVPMVDKIGIVTGSVAGSPAFLVD